jgi:hypothetical protein
MIPTTTIPEGVTNAWGSLYSVTGEKIGACFFDPSAEKDSSIVFAPATTPIMTTMAEVAQQQVATAAPAAAVPPTSEPTKVRVKRKKKHKRRIFIGVLQESWGYTDPRIKPVETERCPKRSYNSMPRYYIGKKKYLFYPAVEEDEESSSSLTPMDESDDEAAKELDGADGEGGLCFYIYNLCEPLYIMVFLGKSFFPDSLGDRDITRAIFLGLTACGFAAVPAI